MVESDHAAHIASDRAVVKALAFRGGCAIGVEGASECSELQRVGEVGYAYLVRSP